MNLNHYLNKETESSALQIFKNILLQCFSVTDFYKYFFAMLYYSRACFMI